MATLSRLSARSAARSKAEVTQQLILFQLRDEWFALPIAAAHRVVPLSDIHGNHQGNGTGLMHYQNQDIPVLDMGSRIFGDALPQSQPDLMRDCPIISDDRPLRYLLIVKNLDGELVGLPIDSQPTLRRVPHSAFAPIPPTYLHDGKVRCVSALVRVEKGQIPAFLLNLDQLFQSPSALISEA